MGIPSHPADFRSDICYFGGTQEKDVFLWALPRSDRIVIQLSFFLFILVYLFCMLDSTSCITYVEMLRVCNASIEL